MERLKTFVKICGIKRFQDVLNCYEAGVNAIGFIFFENSERYIPFNDLKSFIKDLPPITKIGVFPSMNEGLIKEKMVELSLDGIQVYHNLKEDFSGFLKIRAFFYPEKDIEILNYDFILFDFKRSGFEEVPFDIAFELKKNFGTKPLIFAGNLNKKNIKDFIKKVRPFGVDISRGVEKAPGIKDKELIFEIIEKIKEAENET